MYSFSKEYKHCPAGWDDRLMLTYVEAQGSDLEDMLANAMISLEDWHGNQGPDWDLYDLPDSLIEMIQEDMASAIQDAIDRKAEDQAERNATVRSLNSANGWIK